MFKPRFTQVFLLCISALSLLSYAENAQLNGVRIEHTSIYQGDCVRVIDQGIDVTDDCSSLVAIMYLADSRIAINFEDVNHKTTTFFSVPVVKNGAEPVQRFPVKEMATASRFVELKGTCESGDFYKVRSLVCSANSVDGEWSFEYQNLIPISAEK